MEFSIYLAGPITGLSFTEATDWRFYVKQRLPSYIKSLSPMRAKSYLDVLGQCGSDGKIKQTYEDYALSSEKGINSRDFNDVKRCDLILVNMLGAKTVSIGTVMEIAWARAFGKLVVLAMEPGNIHDHTMLKYACGFITPTLDEAINLVVGILSSDEQLDKLALNKLDI